MSIYIIVCLLLIISAVFAKKDLIRENGIDTIMYIACFFILTCMLCFRYGQGNDYLAYEYLYNLAPDSFNFHSPFYGREVHGEIGWKLITNFFNILHIDFKTFVFLISLFEMIMLHKSIVQFSSQKNLSLLMGYPTLFLTYFFSALRQGIVIATFLGVLLTWLCQKKYKRYIFVTLILILIHRLAVILIVVPIVICLNKKCMKFMFLGSIVVCIVMSTPISSFLLKKIGLGSYSVLNYSFFGAAERLSKAVIIFYLYARSRNCGLSRNSHLHLLVKLYFTGVCIYISFIPFSTLASRLTQVFLGLEILLIPTLLFCNKKIDNIIFSFCIAVSAVLTLKNISAYISQGNYYGDINIFNYPYVSIFNQSALDDYRSNPYLE